VQLIEPGKPLAMRDVPTPSIGPGECLVRVKAAGICRSDLHYRAGVSPVRPLPLTLGHEIAGVVEQVGADSQRTTPILTLPRQRERKNAPPLPSAGEGPGEGESLTIQVGDRVAIHYVVSCGQCAACRQGHEQFCAAYSMVGKYRDGGFAEFVAVPARNCVPLPAEIPFEHGAVLMCSSATAFHALQKAEIAPGDLLAVFGLGGLGMSAIQLARAFGVSRVFAVDIDPAKLALAADLGAVPINNRETNAVAVIQRLTEGIGVDVAIELIGLPVTIRQAIDSLAPLGRALVVGLSDQLVEIDPYRSLIGKEAKLIGVNDHLARELPVLIELARCRMLDLSRVVAQTVSLDADAVNAALDRLATFSPGTVRTVVVP
jgi:D-arabinose 1-dehydrogenase-like Zn-dependent alcohol dehydrogenase